MYMCLHVTLLQLYVINLASWLQYANKFTYLLTYDIIQDQENADLWADSQTPCW